MTDLAHLDILDHPDASALEQIFISFNPPDADVQYLVVARSAAGVSDANRRVILPAAAVAEFERYLAAHRFERQPDDPDFMHIWVRRHGQLPD